MEFIHIMLTLAFATALLGRRIFRAPPPLPAPAAERPPLSVVIPARDEEQNLHRLLPALLAQCAPGDEIIVVDDHSTDATARAARGHGARVIAAPELPPGWTGKNHALACGYRAARAERILFLDADLTLAPGGLERLRAAFREHAVFSVLPFHEVPTAAEQGSLFFNMVMAAGVGAFDVPASRSAGLFGQCLGATRAAYEKAGTHARVRGEILENFFLAGALRDAGVPFASFGGAGAVRMRMYPEGFCALARGWSKAFARGAGKTPPARLGAITAWLGAATAAALAPLSMGGGPALWPALALYALFVAQVRIFSRELGGFRAWAAWLFPLPLLAYHAIFFASLLPGRRGRWKGRAYGA